MILAKEGPLHFTQILYPQHLLHTSIRRTIVFPHRLPDILMILAKEGPLHLLPLHITVPSPLQTLYPQHIFYTPP
jgi:hypothetical protein